MISAAEALERLKQGNARFAAGADGRDALEFSSRRSLLLEGQEPFAVILGCSDSRVPVEIVFDQGLGDLFVIRVAGNIVARTQIGSVEFAAQKFGARLVVVLGHSRCGAVQATLEALTSPDAMESRNLSFIVDSIRPSVEPLIGASTGRRHLVHDAMLANVQASVGALQHGSDILERLIAEDGLCIVGAAYSLESGRVEFLDGAGT